MQKLSFTSAMRISNFPFNAEYGATTGHKYVCY